MTSDPAPGRVHDAMFYCVDLVIQARTPSPGTAKEKGDDRHVGNLFLPPLQQRPASATGLFFASAIPSLCA
jgi:hypothetical protein